MKDLAVAAALAAILPLAVAQADDAATSPLQPLESALERSVSADRDDDWRFVMTVTRGEGELVARFDGSRPEDERWSLVSPAEADLGDGLRALWEDLRSDDDEDDGEGGLFFSREDALFRPGSVDLHVQDADDVTYRFQPEFDEDDADNAPFADYLQGEITVGRDRPGVRQMRLWAPESFKPNFAIRVNRFELVQEFAELEGMPAPVLVRMSQNVSGRAAFQTFEEGFEIGFSEIEYLGDQVR